MFTSDIAFSQAVKQIQHERGSRRSYARLEESTGGFADAISTELASYIAARESFYLATSNAAGQPYVQHRGGPRGFLKVLDERTLAFADFVGNRQYVTTGNLLENDRVFLFLMNYDTRERIKVWGRARVVTGDATLLEILEHKDYKGRVEQAIVFTVSAWDANCPQHIPRLVPLEWVEQKCAALEQRVRYLETTLARAGVAFEKAIAPP